MTNDLSQGIASLPRVLQGALRALSSPNRQKIALEISRTDQLSFSELLEKTQLNKGTLYRHLAELESGGIVVNYYQKLADTKVYSFYELTPFGISILTSLFGIVRGKGLESRPSWTFGAIDPAYNVLDPDEVPTSQRVVVVQAKAGSSASDRFVRGGTEDSQTATGTVGGSHETL